MFPAATQPVVLPQHSFVLPGTAAESGSSSSGGVRSASGTVVFPTSPDNTAEPSSHRLAVPARKIGDLTGANVDASGSVKLGAAEPGRAVHKGSPHDVHATPDAAPPASPSAQPTQRTGQSLPQVPSTPRRRQDAGKRSAKHTRRKRGKKSKRKSRTSVNKRRKKDQALAAPTGKAVPMMSGETCGCSRVLGSGSVIATAWGCAQRQGPHPQYRNEGRQPPSWSRRSLLFHVCGNMTVMCG